jgi:hypothetical protein
MRKDIQALNEAYNSMYSSTNQEEIELDLEDGRGLITFTFNKREGDPGDYDTPPTYDEYKFVGAYDEGGNDVEVTPEDVQRAEDALIQQGESQRGELQGGDY